MSIVEETVDLIRDFESPAATVFAAWSDENAQRIWGDPGDGWSMSFDTFQFAVGKADICRFGPAGGQDYVNENRYVVIDPGKRIVYATSLANAGLVSFAGTVAVDFEPIAEGTRIRLIEQGLYFDGPDDVECHRSGWQGMLNALGSYLRRE